MADTQTLTQPVARVNVRLRCPRCRALLDISQVDARKPFSCGGCALKTDVAACVTATEGYRPRRSLLLAMMFIPPAVMGWFFTLFTALFATGFGAWMASFVAAGAGALVTGMTSCVVQAATYQREAPRIATKFAMAVMTMALPVWLIHFEGDEAVSDTAQAVLRIVAFVWLGLCVLQILAFFRGAPIKAVAPVVELDTLKS